MRFASLGSGSRGNATLLQSGGTLLLIDCGFGLREAGRRLARLGVSPGEVSALLLTHEHGDHAGGCGPFLRRHRLTLHATGGTLRAAAGALGELPG
ncbi:MAG: MBL fold metallo-hydrolase, partial [Gammaproteobacteria bacterium]